MPTRRIGELLVAEGLISEAAIARALGYQRVSGDRVKLGSILLGWDLLDEEALLTGLGKLHRCPPVSAQILLGAEIETVRMIPAAQAIRLGAVAYQAEKGLVRVAFVNPSDLAASDEIAARTGRRVVPAVTSEARLFQAHQKFYGRHIPLEYRPILAKLQRRSTTTALRAGLDFREGDLVESERSSTEVPLGGPARRTSIPVEIRPEPEAAPENPAELSLALPEFPPVMTPPVSPDPPATAAASDASSLSERGRTSLRTGDDSLTEWVGRALSSFTGDETREPRRSPGGVADPALFGRPMRTPPANPGALENVADSLPPTNAFRSRAEGAAAERKTPPAPDAAHSVGIPSTIPPFRRSTDPSFAFSSVEPVAPLDREDDVVAGMWRPGPDEPAEETPRAAVGRPSSDVAASLSAAARSRDEIADSVLAGALERLPRVLLLAAGRTGVTGWRGRGPGLTPAAVAAIRIPNSEICVFTSVQESGIPHFGSIDRAEWPRALAALFGPTPPDCAVFPIRLLDGVAAFLYADRLAGPMQYEDFAVIARAAASAAGVLSRFLLRSDRPSSPVRG